MERGFDIRNVDGESNEKHVTGLLNYDFRVLAQLHYDTAETDISSKCTRSHYCFVMTVNMLHLLSQKNSTSDLSMCLT